MLDAHHVVVAAQTERGDDALPFALVVAPSDAAKEPRTLRHPSIGLGVEDAVDSHVLRIDCDVFGMHVEDGAAERANGSRDVDTLPEEVAGIEIHPEVRPGGRAQLQRGLDVVHDEARMRLERHLHAAIPREAFRLPPVGNRLLVPLPFEHVEKFGRPRRRDPIRMLRLVCIAGAAREGHDDRYLELRRKADGFAKLVVVRLCGTAIRMKRVAVTRQCADCQAGIAELPAKLSRPLLILCERVDVEMVVTGPSARSKLERLNLLERPHLCQHLVERQLAEDRREETKFHKRSYVRTSVQTPPRRWLSSTASTRHAAR